YGTPVPASTCFWGARTSHASDQRVALAAGATFLHVNGIDFIVDEREAVIAIHSVCEDATDEAALAAWFRANSAPM
ncbi:hypothetical protein HOI71_19500, partial [Candidatus Poribacteria bacterium]|nr:hypothetical protein [Candidatus Poribacteria bacterium]